MSARKLPKLVNAIFGKPHFPAIQEGTVVSKPKFIGLICEYFVVFGGALTLAVHVHCRVSLNIIV